MYFYGVICFASRNKKILHINIQASDFWSKLVQIELVCLFFKTAAEQPKEAPVVLRNEQGPTDV